MHEVAPSETRPCEVRRRPSTKCCLHSSEPWSRQPAFLLDAKPSQSVVAPRARRKCPFVTGAKRCSTGDTSPQNSAGFPPAAEEAQPDRRSQISRRAGPSGHCSAPPHGADLSAGPAFLRGTKASGALPRSEPLRGSLLRTRQPPSAVCLPPREYVRAFAPMDGIGFPPGSSISIVNDTLTLRPGGGLSLFGSSYMGARLPGRGRVPHNTGSV